MAITTETDLLEESQPSAPSILLGGFALARRNWPLIVWAYGINLMFGMLAGTPFSPGLAPLLDHSLAAQRIAGTLDLTALLELGIHLRETHFVPIAFTRLWNWLELLILFLFSAGTVFVYLTGEPPRFANLVRGGLACFWRFVRGNLLAGCLAGLLLGVLLASRAALLAHLSQAATGRTLFTYEIATAAIVFIVAMLSRLWLDLVEMYIVRLTLQGELRARRALLPAYKLLLRHFVRLSGGFFLAGLCGTAALGLCLLLWKWLPANQVWAAAVLAQTGLFLLLAARYWQRGLEASLLLTLAPVPEPVAAPAAIEEVPEQEPAPLPVEETVSGLAEPTLMELVQKLRNDPWTRPTEITPASLDPPRPTSGLQAVDVEQAVEQATDTPLNRHAAKFPLGGAPQVEPVAEDPKTDPL